MTGVDRCRRRFVSSFPACHVNSFPASHVSSFPASHVSSFPASHVSSFPASNVSSFPASHVSSSPASHVGVVYSVSAVQSILSAWLTLNNCGFKLGTIDPMDTERQQACLLNNAVTTLLQHV